MLEASGHCLQDLNGIFSGFTLAMATVKPCCNRQHDDNKSIPKNRNEEEYPFCKSRIVSQKLRNDRSNHIRRLG